MEVKIMTSNKNFAKFININGKYRFYNDESDLIKIYQEQIEQLTNNWNELEEYLNHEIEEWQDVSDDWTIAQVQEDKIILDKMKEIKDNDKV